MIFTGRLRCAENRFVIIFKSILQHADQWHILFFKNMLMQIQGEVLIQLQRQSPGNGFGKLLNICDRKQPVSTNRETEPWL